MSYSAQETSAYGGAPVELYEFRYGSTYYRFTSDPTSFFVNTTEYEAVPITRTGLELTQEIPRAAPKITIDASVALLDVFRAGMPAEFVTLTISRRHRGDADSIVVWAGRVVSAAWQGAQAVLTCESVITSIKRTGLRRLYQKQCPHVLYSTACGLSGASFRSSKPVLGVNGAVLTLDNLNESAGHFVGGYVEWDAPGGVVERRAISAQVSNTVTMTYSMPGLTAGQTVKVYAGCDHTLATCNTKFSNAVNYGGFPYIPTKNPFGGSPMY